MLNSDWPITPEGVRALAAPNKVDAVVHTMQWIWWDRPFTLAGIELFAGAATLHLVTPYGAGQDIELRTNDDGMVIRFDVTTLKPNITSWQDLDAVLKATGARYSYQAAKVDAGHCAPVAGANTTQSLPLASIFKLYVLYAVAEAVKAGTVSWDDQLTITDRLKVVGSPGFEKLPAGAQVSVRAAANTMIADSDNMATDMLIEKVGTRAVERALAEAGHHDPASMTPFPTMYQLFSIAWGIPDKRAEWQHASPSGRAELLQQAGSRPFKLDPAREHTPASQYGVEWFGTAEDICRVHAALQNGAVGAAAPVKEIMSAVSGIALDSAQWPYVGSKAGSLPGDLTFSWYAVDDTGQAWVVSIQLNWTRFFGLSVWAWMIQVAQQAFALLPRQH